MEKVSLNSDRKLFFMSKRRDVEIDSKESSERLDSDKCKNFFLSIRCLRELLRNERYFGLETNVNRKLGENILADF